MKKGMIILGCLASLSANAAMYQCQKGEVSLPCETKAWDIAGDAIFMSQTGGILPNILAFGNQSWNMDYDWGFRVEGSRHFGKGTDVNINWTYFKQKQDFIDNASSAAGGGGIYPTANTPFTYSDYMSVVNLELGQQVDFGEKWAVRMHAGLQVDTLQGKMESVGTATATGTSNLVGPRIGLDLAYQVWSNLGFYTNGAIGGLYSSLRATGPDLGLLGAVRTLTHNWVQNGGVTELDFNIGLKYTHTLAQGDLTGRVGWTSYSFSHTTANVTWQGLIVGAKWVGNA